ncbi:class I SAM-dependent methyltransferase [Methylocystis parvus]|uniref:Class I SAM-dependent methyltransferase n=1 Tax=Methylocystis parvus TaxID=134 RepID=A0A6B8M984_9HYPH|nr:SAM-dependent methyltransferase [Methylocystis parvus]QGM97863.1 class I SAM-dependent methyltransferase [Methylocystis parvus]WBK01828.1 SAM-dependent methyltransferase [Methylocystis parvus OBBP]
MNPLKQEIAATIAHEGPMTLEHYMSLCLGHPRHGYYMTRDPFGADGDFITAPEISQMFGELIGVWTSEAWRMSGSPSPARLIELGPGRGTLMSDVLRVSRISPGFLDAVSVHLVETSPTLRAIQRQTLDNAGKPVGWSADVGETPPGPAFILANEFFDALPVRHYVKTIPGWRERLVGLDPAGELTFGLSDRVETSLRAPAQEGSIIEVSPVSQRIMGEIAARLVRDGGALLMIDYGYTETTLGDSLQAVSKHVYVDPLAAPGEADLTAHVDFAALARAAKAAGAKVMGPVTQGHFLLQLGIERRAQALMKRATPEQQQGVVDAFDRLTGVQDPRRHMGALFKVMAVTHPDMPDMPGFIV